MPYFTHQEHRLFYREAGEGALMLVLPGNTASSACHQGELSYFGQRFHTASLDYWGTGLSDRLLAWPHDWFQSAAHDADALAAHLGAERCLVMGTSGGAAVALWMAILHPERVQAVIADSVIEHLTADWAHRVASERARRTPDQLEFWQYAHGDDWEQVVKADTAMLFSLVAEKDIDAFQGRLGEIACPVLLTASRMDNLLPDIGQQVCHMVRQMPTSSLFLFPQGDHPLMWSRPKEFRTASECFLATLS